MPKVGVAMLVYWMIWYCYCFLSGFKCTFQLYSSVFSISWYRYRYHVTLYIGQQHPITVYRTVFGCALFWCWVSLGAIVMHPPLGTGGIMFSGCPSVRPSVRSLKYPILTCTWVRWSTRPTVTVLRHVRSSVRRGFRAFAGERMEGMARNFTCWFILTIFRTD